METDKLVEVLIAYNTVLGNNNLVALLEEKKSIREYIGQVIANDEEERSKLKKEVEVEREKEKPNELIISIKEGTIKMFEDRQDRITKYLYFHKGE